MGSHGGTENFGTAGSGENHSLSDPGYNTRRKITINSEHIFNENDPGNIVIRERFRCGWSGFGNQEKQKRW